MSAEAQGAARKGEPLDLRTVIDTIPALVVCALPDGSIEFVNQAWREYTGSSLDELTGWGWQSVLHPDDVSRFIDEWNAARAAGKPFENEARVRRADGQYHWFLIRKVPLRDRTDKIVRWYGTACDIEDRKYAEDGLRLVLDTTPTLIHTGRPDGYLDYFNQRCLDYTGLSLSDMCGWRWTDSIHPDDVEGMLLEWRSALASGEPFQYEARVRRADGEYRWMLHRNIALRDEHGKIVKWYGSSTEIEERKRAEEKIRLQEMELRQVLDLTPQHVAVLEADGSHIYLNQAGLDYYGLTLDELQPDEIPPAVGWRISGFPLMIVHPDDRERVMSEVKSTLSSGFPHKIESRTLGKDGKYRWLLSCLSPLRDAQGHITRWYAASIDIEDRKQAEERLQHENVALREEIDKASMFEEIVGTSAVLRTVLSRVSKVAPTDSTVLIAGETGTGKELVARAINRRSRRSSRALVGVNCAAVPRDLIASELFGHEKGAFTGATHRRLGRFELAEGGTIFLDEVGELPAETQIALLRVLQENEFERIGGTGSIRTDVRVIAATNRDLQAAIAAGTFRRDLFYRLNVFPIEIPPLRERSEDIPLLVEYFVDRYARKAGKSIRGVNKKSLDLLQSYPWPGNIRELQNVIERSVILCEAGNFSVDESWLSRQPLATESKTRSSSLKGLPLKRRS